MMLFLWMLRMIILNKYKPFRIIDKPLEQYLHTLTRLELYKALSYVCNNGLQANNSLHGLVVLAFIIHGNPLHNACP